jgi:hypothetical protein
VLQLLPRLLLGVECEQVVLPVFAVGRLANPHPPSDPLSSFLFLLVPHIPTVVVIVFFIFLSVVTMTMMFFIMISTPQPPTSQFFFSLVDQRDQLWKVIGV